MAALRNPAATRWDPDRAMQEEGIGSPFPGRISFGDLDFEVEIGGWFLVCEGKRDFGDGNLEPLKSGQRIAMNARVRDGRTVLVWWGDPEANVVTTVQVWPHAIMPGSWRTVYWICKQWAQWAKLNRKDAPNACPFLAHIEPAIVRRLAREEEQAA